MEKKKLQYKSVSRTDTLRYRHFDRNEMQQRPMEGRKRTKNHEGVRNVSSIRSLSRVHGIRERVWGRVYKGPNSLGNLVAKGRPGTGGVRRNHGAERWKGDSRGGGKGAESRARIAAKSENASGALARCLFSFKVEAGARGQMAIIRSGNSRGSCKQSAGCVRLTGLWLWTTHRVAQTRRNGGVCVCVYGVREIQRGSWTQGRRWQRRGGAIRRGGNENK